MAVTRIGAGAGGTSTSAAFSFNGPSIATSDANTVAIVAVGISVSTNSALTTCSVTYGGVAMTQLNLTLLGSSTNRSAVGLYYLFNPGTGVKSVTVTPAGTATRTRVAAQAVAFSGVAAVGVGAAQTAATTTHSVTSVANGYDLRALVNGAALTSPNQTQEYLGGASVGGVGDYLAVQSAAGTGSNISFTSSGTATTPGSVATSLTPYVYVPPNDPMSTLTDDFNTGTTPDAAKWDSAAGLPTLSGGDLLIPPGGILGTHNAYDLTGSYFYFQAKAVNTDMFVGSSDFWGWTFTNSNTILTQGLPAALTRTHTNGDWYRIRELSGSLYWDYSTDGTNWTNLGSDTTANVGTSAMTSQGVVFYNQGATTTCHFDNFNTTPPTSSGAFFAHM